MIGKVYTLIRKLRDMICTIVNKLNFKYFGVKQLGGSGKIEGILTIRSAKKGTIEIGRNVQFRSGKNYNIIGGDTRLILHTYQDGVIKIGNNVGIANSAIVSMNHIEIEDDVFIGGSCKIWDTDFHSLYLEKRLMPYDTDINSKPILIKEGAFIGGNTIILKGVTVGERSIVGAGSVVTKNIPDGEIWAGNPAKFIRKVEL